MPDLSLIEQFNASVKFFEAQTDDEWAQKAMTSLCRKFTLLAKGADTDEERAELVRGMTDFMADYIGKPFNDPNDYEGIDCVTGYIGDMGNALLGAASPGMIAEGTARQFNRLAAGIIGLAEDADDTDCDTAFRDQAEKVSCIADALEKLEAASSSPAAPQDKTGANGSKLTLKL